MSAPEEMPDKLLIKLVDNPRSVCYGMYINAAGGKEYVRADLAPLWQDIATAPKDGTQVDLWSDRGFRYPNAAWDVVDYPMDASGDNIYGWTDSSHHGSIKNGGPYTHWMPLPTPPETKP